MTPEQWQRVREVLHGALELAPEQRSAFLEQACSTDHSLRKEVESLLQSADRARSDFLPSSAVRLSLPKGLRLGDYEVQSQIGSGGMGEVYRARDLRLHRDVAIKVLPAFASSHPDRLRRFEQEARAAAALSHPNILAVFQLGTYESVPYLVSELLEGLTLREYLRRGRLSLRKTIDYAIQIAQGLAAAHHKGIVHRDLKPENLFVTREDRVKILDFGLAKLTQEKSDLIANARTLDSETEAGVVMGTVGYMAPEQVRGEATDHSADIFALGATLYEMLTGKRAFQGATCVETMGAILKDEPVPLTEIVPAISPALQRIVHRCLEKDSTRRFHSAWDLAFALESLPYLELSADRTRRRYKEVRWLSVALLLILLGFGVAYLGRVPSQQRAMHFSIVVPSSARDLAISPNGRTLAFVAPQPNAGGNVLWVHEIGSTEAHSLANTEGSSYPFWSPDGRSIGFFADGKLKRIEATGGAVLVLCDSPSGRGGTWNKDGTIIFTPTAGGGLARVSASGGSPTLVADVLPGTPHFFNVTLRWPSFLPDGKHFLYSMVDFSALRSDTNAVYVGKLDSNERQRLVVSNSNAAYVPGYLLFCRNGTLMAQRFDAERLQLIGETFAVTNHIQYLTEVARCLVSVSANGTLIYQSGPAEVSQLEWFDRAGKRLSTLGPPARFANPQISPDGSKVTVGIDDPDSETDIWLADVKSRVRSRFTFDPSADETPIWSPDGASVLWVSQRGGGNNFYRKRITGSGTEELIPNPSPTVLDLPTDWSPNRRLVLYTATRRGDWVMQMRFLTLTGESSSNAFVHSQSSETEGRFSPDGHWVAYSSNESGRWQIYVVPFPGPGGKYQISIEGGQQPRWGRDGKELFFLAPDKKLMAAPIKLDATFEFGQPTALFQTHAREPLSSEELFTYDVSPDGQRFLINSNLGGAIPASADIVLKWTSELGN